jgi:hypothetical protein
VCFFGRELHFRQAFLAFLSRVDMQLDYWWEVAGLPEFHVSRRKVRGLKGIIANSSLILRKKEKTRDLFPPQNNCDWAFTFKLRQHSPIISFRCSFFVKLGGGVEII